MGFLATDEHWWVWWRQYKLLRIVIQIDIVCVWCLYVYHVYIVHWIHHSRWTTFWTMFVQPPIRGSYIAKGSPVTQIHGSLSGNDPRGSEVHKVLSPSEAVVTKSAAFNCCLYPPSAGLAEGRGHMSHVTCPYPIPWSIGWFLVPSQR